MRDTRVHPPFGLAICLAAMLLSGCVTDGEALTASPTGTVQSLVTAGDARRASGDLPGAAALYRSAMEASGGADKRRKLEPTLRLAETLAAGAAFADAADTFREALSFAPGDSRVHRGLANALIGLGQPGLAIPYYEDALALEPEDWRIYLGLGVAQDLSGMAEAARATYRAGLDHSPDNPDLINNLALSHALAGQGETAATLLEPLIHLHGTEPRYRSSLAIAYALQNREAEAARLMSERILPEQVARNLELLRSVRAMPDHAQRALAIQTVYAG